MTDTTDRPDGYRRMIEELASARGGRPEMIRRALALCRQFAFSPWVAWAVVEGKTTLAEAARLDGASKCAALQTAILDRGLRIADLETRYPYAPYFLAHDLTVAGGGPMRRIAEALVVARAVLAGERGGASPDDDSAPREIGRAHV